MFPRGSVFLCVFCFLFSGTKGWCQGLLKCFNCGREGHKKKDCKLPPKQQNGLDRPRPPTIKPNITHVTLAYKGKAKLYVVEVDENNEEMRTVKGTILMKDNKINILFDSGCTHSFIASRIVKSLRLQTFPLTKSFRVAAATGDFEVTILGVTNLS